MRHDRDAITNEFSPSKTQLQIIRLSPSLRCHQNVPLTENHRFIAAFGETMVFYQVIICNGYYEEAVTSQIALPLS